MNNTAARTLEGHALLATQLVLAAPTTVAGVIYGISLTLFCLYIHALVPCLQDEDRKRQAKFMLAYSTVIMLCGLYILVANAWLTQDAYIKHSSDRGGPFLYIARSAFHSTFIIVLFASETAVDILTSAIQIWRVWVVWRATRYSISIIVLPMLCFLTFVALNSRSIILQATLPIEKVVRLDTKTDIAEIAIQGAVTLLCTASISLFLIYQHWRQKKLIGRAWGSAGYMKNAAFLIESYALESIWLLIAAALANTNIFGILFTETQTYIEITAYFLVQYRVANGKAYESQMGQNNMSSLHWNKSNHATTQFEATSEAGGNRDVPMKPGALDALSISSMA